MLAILGILAYTVWYMGVRANGWPRKRKMYTGNQKLDGKTVLITGGVLFYAFDTFFFNHMAKYTKLLLYI